MIGEGEWIVILFVLVVVFSASRMGSLGNAVGKFVYSYKKAAKGEDFVDVRPLPRGGEKHAPEDGQIVEPPKR